MVVVFLLLMAGVCDTNTNDIREEIKRRINMGNACYFHLLSKKLKVNAYKTVILPVYCMVVKLDFHFERGAQVKGLRV